MVKLLLVIVGTALISCSIATKVVEVEQEEPAVSNSDAPIQQYNIIDPEPVNNEENVEDIEEEEDEDHSIDPVTGKRMYNDYKLIRVTPETKEQLKVLNFIAKGKPDNFKMISS